MISKTLNLEIWDRLFQGKSLDGLALEAKNGRLDLSGLELPELEVVRRFQLGRSLISATDPGAVIHGAKWRNLDFSGSRLSGMRLVDGELRNCRFDRCQLQDLRIWSTTIADCSFQGANLKKSALGAVQDSKRNTYSGVDFSDADLRESIYKAAAFERCIFRGTKLEKIDFQTSTFTDCLFDADLRDVLFYRRGFDGDAFPANEMVNVDFTRAKLHHVGFRGLTLDRVTLPEDADHIVIKNASVALEKLIAALNRQGDTTAKQLAAFLNIDRKWIPPTQAQRVINAQDLAESVSVEGVNRLRELLCSNPS